MSPPSLPRPPEPLKRRRVRGPRLHEGAVELRTVTPVLGGATEPRKVDQVDVIRAPTVRGHLRFWWRALYGVKSQDAKELLARERELWGGMGTGGGEPVRSQVELRVSMLEPPGTPDTSPLEMRSKEAYALWPARAEGDGNPAERWRPGLRFRLEWRLPERVGDRSTAEEVEAAVRAWVLFGGYGSRTRRGCGSLTVGEEQAKSWLPEALTAAALEKLFSHAGLRLEPGPAPSGQTPSLHGASLFLDSARTAEAAWHDALGWLREFRQGEAPPGKAPPGQFARAHGGKPRPGRSHWPEPDKIRQLLGRFPDEHNPRYNAQPAWPRANFGLPIQFKFQQKFRGGPPYAPQEPGGKKGFMLLWSEGGSTEHDRLASALLVKALPLAGGGFAPMALWLSRQLPEQARVFLKDQERGRAVPGSEAPFTRLVGEGETALYEPLRQKDLRTAFFHWLRSP